MLVSPKPPTAAQLLSLPQSNTADVAVFLWCTEQIKKQEFTEKKVHVYIGSASKVPGGLSLRQKHMLSELFVPHDERLKLKVGELGLNLAVKCKVLLAIPFNKKSRKALMEVRQLLVLTRLILMIWLGAIGTGANPIMKDLVPWRREDIEYLGLASDNPLMINLNGSGGTKKRVARSRTNTSAVGKCILF